MKGSMERARELATEIKMDAWIPSQFDNPANPSIHELTTAREIMDDFPEGIDYLVTGVGTGGHITGVSRILKKQMPGIKVICCGTGRIPGDQWRGPGSPWNHGHRCRFYPGKPGHGAA